MCIQSGSSSTQTVPRQFSDRSHSSHSSQTILLGQFCSDSSTQTALLRRSDSRGLEECYNRFRFTLFSISTRVINSLTNYSVLQRFPPPLSVLRVYQVFYFLQYQTLYRLERDLKPTLTTTIDGQQRLAPGWLQTWISFSFHLHTHLLSEHVKFRTNFARCRNQTMAPIFVGFFFSPSAKKWPSDL